MIPSSKNLVTPRSRYFHSLSLTYQFDVISHLVVRNFIVKYKGAMLGVLWAIFIPLSQLLVLSFIFGKVVPFGIKGYPAFLFVGILPWNWFSLCLNSAGLLFISNRDVMRKANFIPLNLVIVDILINLLGFLLLLPILLLFITLYHEITVYVIYLPLILMIQAFLTLGLSLLIATLNVFYRDIQYIVTTVTMLLFFVTPIFYGRATINPKYQVLIDWNPIAVLIDAYRSILYYGNPPNVRTLLYPIIVSLLTCLLGYIIYHTQLHKVFDYI